MENIIRIEDLPEFVEKTILAVREGVALTRAAGLLAELPKEIKFDMVVVSAFQALEVSSRENSTSTDSDQSESQSTGTDNGTSTDTNSGTDTTAGSDSSQQSSYGYNRS